MENLCQSSFTERGPGPFSPCSDALVSGGFSQGQNSRKVRGPNFLVLPLSQSPSLSDPLFPCQANFPLAFASSEMFSDFLCTLL